MGKGKWIALGCLGLVVLAVVVGVVVVGGTYNRLNELDQQAQAQWANVQSAYQRRLDLIPNLVETVKGAASFEKDTFTAIAEARSQAGQVTGQALEQVTKDPAAFERFQQAQAGLSSALSRLMAVAENYPQLKATDAFRDLQAQLEGTENRISVERNRFNDAARVFNTARNSFPTVMIAGFFGDRFKNKPYFAADEGAKTAPKVDFNK